MKRTTSLVPAATAVVLLALAAMPAAVAAPPALGDLTPPPPDIYTCKALGGGTICTAETQDVKVAEPQPELVCGSGADAFVIHDNGEEYSRFTRWYDADGNLVRRVEHEVWLNAFWSNPLSGKRSRTPSARRTRPRSRCRVTSTRPSRRRPGRTCTRTR